MKRLLSFSTLLLLILILAACRDTGPINNSANPSNTGPNNSQTPLSPFIGRGTFREFPLPQSNSGLMRPAIDSQGRIWFGEMGRNYLAVFDPHTQTFQQITPPHGQSGIMGIVVALDDSIWFAEQYANYIGHYIPTMKTFQTYSLPKLTVPDPGNPGKTLILPSAPNDLALDKHGNIWFTELNADSLGKLDPTTGHIQQYPLAANKSVQKLNPYGIAVTSEGMIWFTESSNTNVGRLDPTTSHIHLFPFQGPPTAFMEITSDIHDTLWISTFAAGLIVNLNPNTATFTSYTAPSSGNGTGGIYGIIVTPTGKVWATISTENAIAQLDAASKRFTYYPIPTKGSLPLGLIMSTNHTIWFTEAGVDKLGMLKP